MPRAFKGTIVYPKKANGEAQRLASDAQKAALWVDGKPHFNLFVDGSYRKQGDKSDKPKGRKRDLEYRAWGPGGYGVIFRNPYHEKGPAELDHNHDGEAERHPDESEDGLGPGNFNIRYWHSYRVLSSNHAELAALPQGLETVVASVRKHRPPSASVTVFTDSIFSLNRLTPRPDGQTGNMRDALTLPLVRVIVWQSHYLADRGCDIKLQWLPRNCVLAHRLADSVAGWWKNEGTIFYQMDKPLWRRDGILDTVHEDIVEAVNQIEVQKQPAACLGPKKYGPSKNHAPKTKDTGCDGDILDNFSGSNVQGVIATSALQLSD
ncbi:hypothetical protein B0T13DRAFT_398415 [Neurospora crassa]|nr:hypothetical protein B0T13DRAFT_398415 [Neurospora crassa]